MNIFWFDYSFLLLAIANKFVQRYIFFNNWQAVFPDFNIITSSKKTTNIYRIHIFMEIHDKSRDNGPLNPYQTYGDIEQKVGLKTK